MRRIIIAAAILMLLSPSIIYAAEQDQSGLPMYADRSDSSPGEIGQTEIPLGTIPTQHSTGTYSMEVISCHTRRFPQHPRNGVSWISSPFSGSSPLLRRLKLQERQCSRAFQQAGRHVHAHCFRQRRCGGGSHVFGRTRHDSLSSNPQASSLLGLIPLMIPLP
jgi:hypothetical protein